MSEKMTVGVIGAGTMGSGIAQVAAQAGHATVLFDTRKEAVDKAMSALQRTVDKLIEKGRLTAPEGAALMDRITPATELAALAGCGLVVEAIVEDLAVKKKVFADLEALISPDAVLATNTSSLSVTAIAAACRDPRRVVGLHFFNPAPLMPLVEVVPGVATDPRVRDDAHRLMTDWGKVPVTCKDTPGFIVNRVARPYYGESIRIFEEGVADMATIDHALRSIGGFRMGPFELMDLIGNDINFTVTRTVWESFFYDPRYRPSFTQQRMVEAGWLGRKTSRGYYVYDEKGLPLGTPVPTLAPDLGERIVERVLAMLINEAADALFLNVATAADIDLAMTRGVNYPKGLLAWADERGAAHWLSVLENLYVEFGDDRYRPSPLLRRKASDHATFH